jgi:pimeloyl-ACP methyl ester carboxylesterase
MAAYENRYWWSRDGLRLHYRDYPGDRARGADRRPPLLCLPGLTRNARDYAALAERLAGEWRVIAVDFRGRGESAYAKDPMTYVPLTYVQDIEALLDELAVDRFVGVGTSLGGIVTMLLAGASAHRLAGALLNDVGPEIEAAGLSRIRGYVGRASAYPTWMHAARAVAEAQGDVYPDWEIADWLAMAKRLHRLNSAGRVVLDYDMKIAEPFRVPGSEAGPNMWRALAALNGLPVLLVRGERSDVLGSQTALRMATELDAELVTVPRTGHAPTLSEPVLADPIARWLGRL